MKSLKKSQLRLSLAVTYPIMFMSGRFLCILLLNLQDQVDGADTFPQVLKKVIDWMKVKELGTKYKYCILTDG